MSLSNTRDHVTEGIAIVGEPIEDGQMWRKEATFRGKTPQNDSQFRQRQLYVLLNPFVGIKDVKWYRREVGFLNPSGEKILQNVVFKTIHLGDWPLQSLYGDGQDFCEV